MIARPSFSAFILIHLTAAALWLVHPAAAQTDVSGTSTGTNGNPGTGTPPDENGFSLGNGGGDAYDAYGNNSPSYTVHDANFTGGTGGTIMGQGTAQIYQGGSGGYGLSVNGNAAATVNSGTFTGGRGGNTNGTATPTDYRGGTGGLGMGVGSGSTATINGGTFQGAVGGTATGTATNSVSGGYGGDGLGVNDATVFVNGGAFRGGDSGQASGNAPNVNSGFAGSGLNANNNSTVYVYGGTFSGGNGAVVAGGGQGVAGDGIVGLGGNVYVHGGTFTGGTSPGSGYGIDLYVGNITLYGSFTVNGVPNYMGSLTPGSEGTITGFFDNSNTETTFTYRYLDFGGTFQVVPEPSQWIGGTLLSVIAVVGTVRRMRSRAA